MVSSTNIVFCDFYLLVPFHQTLAEDLRQVVGGFVLQDPQHPQQTEGGLLRLLLADVHLRLGLVYLGEDIA